MIDSFKNFERLRYRLSNDMREIALETKGNSDEIKTQISNTIFATIFSAFITEIVFKENDNGYDFVMIAFQIFIFCFIYVVSYIIYNYLYNYLITEYNKRKVNKIDNGAETMKQIQKDFDNIACDSILVAKSYSDAFSSLSKKSSKKSLKTFYFYEIMHYLDTACEKTKELVQYKAECTRTTQTASGVDIFRVLNLLKMIKELDTFLDKNFDAICNNNPHLPDIQHQHTQIKRKIQLIDQQLKS